MSSNKNIPQLRFPEFTGEWEKKKLGDITSDIYQPKTISKEQFVSSGYPVYGANGIIGYYNRFNHTTEQIAITCRGASCGTVNYTSGKCWITGNAMVINLDDVSTKYNKLFFRHLLDYCDLSSIITGSGQPQIVRTPLLNFVIPVPPTIAEQKKIAVFLTAIDDMIEAQGQRVEALKEKKKGLMQQMFPQKGETTPQLRFPEFTGEWIEKKLGDSFEERIEKNRVDLPLLSLGEEGLFLQSETARKDNSNSDKSKYLRVAIGDIAYNTMRMWQGRCVYSCIEGIVSPAYTVCIPNDNVDSMFHYYLFKTQRMINIFHMHSQGLVSDTLNLKYEAFAKIAYCLPPTLVEQKKIAECLSAMDDVIASETAKLDALKEHKKGLMQQMFPQPTK